ncbi:cobalamin-binding protein [Dentiradicibacter hellwigii]|uniref:Cobalamin-binding protein n=1 Tax=Dentiradicibacter hellwigii TaxID=3149053 RepID=A0ABV4UH05_9RHOO
MTPNKLLWLCLWLLSASNALAAGISVRDDTGATVSLAQPAQRIVTLSPHLAETVFAAGAGGQIVGTVDYSNYPEAARRIPRVGGYSRFDLEAVVALKPDLIIAWEGGNAPAHLQKLRRLGLPVYLSQISRLEDIAGEIERIGVLAGTRQSADTAARTFRQRLADLQARYAGRPVVRTFYEVWHQPLKTIGGQQFISSVIRLCGGENVFGTLTATAPDVTVEAVLAANPEAIIASGMGEARPEWLDDWQARPGLLAAQRKNLFFIPPDLIQRHTPRLLDGAERLCQHLETARSRRPAGSRQ